MTSETIIIFLIGQFIVQTMLYFTIARPINKFVVNHRPKDLKVFLVIENILISVLVMWFTSSGASAGMTNLMASVLLGVIMSIDYNILYNAKIKKDQEELDEYYIIDK